MLLYSITEKLNFTELSIFSFSRNKSPASSTIASALRLCCDEKHLRSEAQHHGTEQPRYNRPHIADVTHTETRPWTAIQPAASATATTLAAAIVDAVTAVAVAVVHAATIVAAAVVVAVFFAMTTAAATEATISTAATTTAAAATTSETAADWMAVHGRAHVHVTSATCGRPHRGCSVPQR